VYFEATTNSIAAIAREKETKAWRRQKKGAADRHRQSNLGRFGGRLV
jgi:predicted GIY-YIG superfamily endonuclease